MNRRRFVALIGATAALAPAEPALLERLLERIRSKRTVTPTSGRGDELVTVVLHRTGAALSIGDGYLPQPSGPRYVQVHRRQAEKLLAFYRGTRGSAVIIRG
jgi:hypothetical protein